MGVGWLAYSGMRVVTGEGCRRRLEEASLHEVQLQRFVSARGPTLQLLFVLHFANPTRSYRPLDERVGFRSPSVPLGPRSDFVPPSLAFSLPAIEHPTLQSVALVLDENLGTSYRPPRGDRQVAVYVAPHSLQHRLIVVPKYHLSLLPLHLDCFGNWQHSLWKLNIHWRGPFWISINLFLPALQLTFVVPYSEKGLEVGSV